jgi:hypothetical protein
MVENFFYGIEGVEKQDQLKEKLNKRDSIEPKAAGRIPIKRRIVMKERNNNQKVLVLEELENSGNTQIRGDFRLGYWIIDRNENWAWGGFAPFIPKEDFKDLIKEAKETGFI